ncbi:MAG TPA: hypothetical protein VG276_21080, partial [Actinomycetes bacterium]|nr:hypothetical protein [Actinomycetes bacterium]
MGPDDVLEIVGRLERAGVAVWLDDGWGVDALLGAQHRPHRDVDPGQDSAPAHTRAGPRAGAGLGLGWGWAGAGLGLGWGWAGAGLGLGWGWAGAGRGQGGGRAGAGRGQGPAV